MELDLQKAAPAGTSLHPGDCTDRSLPLGLSPSPPQGHQIEATRLAPKSASHSGQVTASGRKQQQPIGSDGRSTRTDEEDPDFEGDVDDEIDQRFVEERSLT